MTCVGQLDTTGKDELVDLSDVMTEEETTLVEIVRGTVVANGTQAEGSTTLDLSGFEVSTGTIYAGTALFFKIADHTPQRYVVLTDTAIASNAASNIPISPPLYEELTDGAEVDEFFDSDRKLLGKSSTYVSKYFVRPGVCAAPRRLDLYAAGLTYPNGQYVENKDAVIQVIRYGYENLTTRLAKEVYFAEYERTLAQIAGRSYDPYSLVPQISPSGKGLLSISWGKTIRGIPQAWYVQKQRTMLMQQTSRRVVGLPGDVI